MMEAKQTRVVLPAAIVRACVGLAIVLGLLVLAAVVLLFQLSSLVQHADVALSGGSGLLPTATATVADTGLAARLAIGSAGSQLDGVGNVAAWDLGYATRQVAVTAAKAGPVLDGLHADTLVLGSALDAIARPCNTKDAAGDVETCGTLADANRTMATVRGTFGQIEVAANHEDRNLATLDAQEDQLFTDFHGTATRANTALESFNVLLANPDLALMMKNGADMTSTASQVEAKLAKCTLHPTLPCVLKSDVLFGAQVGGYLLR